MKNIAILLMSAIAFITLTSEDANCNSTEAKSTSGISKTSTNVKTDLNGKTIEQNNVINRLQEDNKPGSIKHLYILSAYSGQVLIYSTVKGKVTSSGKRLSPSKVTMTSGGFSSGFKVEMGNDYFFTDEVLGDDGTYGSSIDYVFWWDSKGIYHQQYVTGGMIMHVSNEPLAVKSVILNMETNKTE